MKNMRNTLFLGSALALAACGGELNSQEAVEAESLATATAELRAAPADKAIEGQYIVVFKAGADHAAEAARMGVSPMFSYSIIPGFAAKLNDAQLHALLRNPNVEYIEQDAVFQADTTQSSATWGIDRIDQRALPLSGTYNYNATAGSVRAYIIDTGLQANHTQFGSRAQNVYDAFGGNGNDCNGHGTHVGGTVGSTTYGVAKAVALRGVKVLDCAGSGSTSGVIAGVDWVKNNHIKPAVANMSLGGGYSSTLNTSVNNLANAGVHIAVAAGNDGKDACNYSPASAANATTTGSTTSSDGRSSFSNYGSCVDIYAPGSSITSTWINSSTKTISGTSMASPHVCGVGALYKATYGDVSSSTIDSWVKNNATSLSFGKLLFKSSL